MIRSRYARRIGRLLMAWVLLAGHPAVNGQTGGEPAAGPADPLYQEGSALQHKGDYPGALAKYEAGLQAVHPSQGRKTAARIWLGIAEIKISQGDQRTATAAAEKARVLAEAIQDPGALAGAWYWLGVLHRLQGRYREAQDHFEKALKISEEGKDGRWTARALRGVGSLYSRQGQFAQALDYYRRALQTAEAAGDAVERAAALTDIGIIHRRQGSYHEALEHYKTALAIYERTEYKKGIADILHNIGLVYGSQGQYREEIAYYEKSLKIKEALGEKGSLQETLGNLGIAYSDQGWYGKALTYQQRALQINEELGNRSGMAAVLNSLGATYGRQGLHEKAAGYFQRALKIREALGEKGGIAAALHNLASAYLSQASYPEAMDCFQRVVKIREEMGLKDELAKTLVSLAGLYALQGDPEKSLAHHQRALAISREIHARSPMAKALVGLGHFQIKRQQYAQAAETLQQALALGEEMKYPEIVWMARSALADLEIARGDPRQALQHYQRAIAEVEKVRAGTGSDEGRAGFLADKIDVYEKLIQLLHRLDADHPAAGYGRQAFEYAERAKARAFLDRLAEAGIDPGRDLAPERREKKRTLQVRFSQAQSRLRREYDKPEPDKARAQSLEKERDALDEEYTQWIADLRRHNPHYADLQYPQPLTLAEAQALLDDRTALLGYVLGAEASYLCAVTRQDFRTYRLPGEKALVASVQKLRAALARPDPLSEATEKTHTRYVELARQLHATLVAPAAALLAGKTQLVIAPDGALNYLPFEVLLAGGRPPGGRIDFRTLPYLARNYTVHYVPSVTVWAALRRSGPGRPAADRKELLAFADPLYPAARAGASVLRGAEVDPYGLDEVFDERNARLGPLPHTRVEVEGIARLYARDQVDAFVGREASERKVKETKLDGYRRVHFATHGVLNETKPQYSALVLSLNQEGEEDGYLMVREIFELKLDADLVVLSACQTGLGQPVRGEGVRGLARAFLYAGTPRVLVSLSGVHDASTADLMRRLYRHLAEGGQTTAAALRQAQRELVNGGRYSHPYYWAPFVLIGEP